jgi:hypothetical protein
VIVPEYIAGDWHAVVAGGVVALLAPSTPPEVVRAVWDAVPARGGLADQLEVLLTGGIAHLHPFALVDLSGARVHAVLRGDVEIEVRGAGGAQVLSAGEVTTWSERLADGADEVTIRVVGAPWASDQALPLVSGVVRSAAVRVRLAALEEGARMERVESLAAPDEVADPPVSSGVGQAWSGESTVIDHVPDAPASRDRDAGAPEATRVLMSTATAMIEVEPVPPTGPLGRIEDTVTPDDHDGMTILSSDLQTIRDQLPSWAGDEVPGPFRIAAPMLAPPAKLVLSTGQVVAVDRTVLLGRAPQVSRVTNRDLPRLVTLPSPQQDISRTHAEVRADGDAVLVTDLHSTNGILVSRPGEGARRLEPGEAAIVEHGEVVDLGDGVTFTVERGA